MSRHHPAPIHIDFLLPGFSKCGTTTLSAMLGQHPALAMPSYKEPNFFTDPHYARRWPDYLALYPAPSEGVLLGDDSTDYTTFQQELAARDRILAHYPEIKIIFIARDPLKRIESSYREFHHSGPLYGLNAEFDPNLAIRQFPAMLEDSMYFRRLNTYLTRVPKQQVLVLFLEDLVSHPQRELHRCFEFLGVDPAPAAAIGLCQMNDAESKLYDSRLLRYLRTHPYWGFKLAEFSPAQQDRVLPYLRLRRVFKQAPRWHPETLAWIAESLADDAQQFLAMQGKALDIWPHFARICRTDPLTRPAAYRTV